MIISRTAGRLAVLATAAGVLAWIVFARADLILTHYDAKAHLVVARRVFDNITPGWQQIGAVWLPLPHLIQLLPTQIDFFYRTGAFASLVSVACFGVTAYAAARLVLAITGSTAGAVTAVLLLMLNPNLLYLQATPMTEPLLLAVTFITVLWLYEWAISGRDEVPLRLGVALFAAAWTRYEAWMVIAAGLPFALFASVRGGSLAGPEGPPLRRLDWGRLARRGWNLGVWPAAAVIVFLLNSRLTVGAWFVTGGFYVSNPMYQGLTGKTLISLWWGTHQMSGYVVETIALLTMAVFAGRALMRRADAALLVPVSLFATAALPFYAFFSGHPYRIRYMIPLVAACALFAGLAVGLMRLRQAPALLSVILVASLVLESPLWGGTAPMIVEAQWDVPASLNRRDVTRCLSEGYRGEKIMASMGSLAHYMQELSHAGFNIADFLNEGNGAIWELAMKTGPRPHAGWMLVEEQAEGGDVLAKTIARDESFAHGMTRVCEGGGVALYRRAPGYRLQAPDQQGRNQ